MPSKKRKTLVLLLYIPIIFWSQNKYTDDWDSLKNYQAPEWYEDAKLGFWVHWGVYSVPAFKGDHAAEWYGRWMYSKEGQSSRDNQGLATFKHHKKIYGNPDKFGYKDLIPFFKAEKFDANNWAELCVKGGAKFFTMMGVHHDSFCLWDTELSPWNSVDMGPKKDLVGLVEKAVRKKGLKFGVSNHSAWNYTFFQWNHINRFDAIDKGNEDLYGNPIIEKGMDTIQIKPNESRRNWLKRSRWDSVKPSERDLDRWLVRTKELAQLYTPDLYYFDWGFNIKEFETRRKEFGAFYYNLALESNNGVFGKPNVVLNYKNHHTFPKGSAIRDFERSGYDQIADMVWQTDDCVYDDHNWGYAENIPIKSTNIIVDELVDIVSKRGVLMLSFAPKADGTIPDDQKKLIFELGNWLKICGEAIYNTRPFETFGEISSNWGKKDDSGKKRFIGTKEDIRFTRSKDYKNIYATFLDWPRKKAVIKSLKDFNDKNIKSIKLIGNDTPLKWKMSKQKGLIVYLPKKPNYEMAFPLKITLHKSLRKIY
ncbi:alpha-L-fucosidase [Aquimarina agarilytica]|uniref:alpha-L-fucosidase n=1 Tax=Aquimarina agarilytica TaxID=1087449 RepID=UPI000289CC7D|nr:alpha-L-fucosidase [Aquimarina agarilytica]